MPSISKIFQGLGLIVLVNQGKKQDEFRLEKDPLGTLEVPKNVYYGIQTARALSSFRISGLTADSDFIKAIVFIKKAACKVNAELGKIDPKIREVINTACDEVLSGRLFDNFVIDLYQAGAGTSYNMNVNEVLANRAIEILGGEKGDYTTVSPNDHVNCSQSTNDIIPTAMRIAVLIKSRVFLEALDGCIETLSKKGEEFHHIIKTGRTHLQDAVPVRLGGEFAAYSKILSDHRERIKNTLEELKTLGIGGTAVGTGMNANSKYIEKMIAELSSLTGFNFKGAENLMASMQSMAPFVAISSAMRNLALDLTKICNDLRLMGSGPNAGLSEISIPAVQPGSSIMPGKVNPGVPEMLNQVCYEVLGNCTTIDYSSQAGQFELNVMMPIINHNLLYSMNILTNALKTWNEKSLKGLKANEERCRKSAELSTSNVTALNEKIGYLMAAEIAKEALRRGITVMEVCKERRILPQEELEKLLDLEKLVGD